MRFWRLACGMHEPESQRLRCSTVQRVSRLKCGHSLNLYHLAYQVGLISLHHQSTFITNKFIQILRFSCGHGRSDETHHLPGACIL